MCPEFSLAGMGSSARSDCRCKQGFYTEDMGLPTSRCVECTSGTFNSELNAMTCSKCAAGKYSSAVNAVGVETCLPCEFGFAAEGQGQCDMCPGNSTALPGSGLLTDCQCNPGYTGRDGETCVFCVPGKFKQLFGSMACSDCPRDTFSPANAREFESDCEQCFPNAEAPPGSDSRDDCRCSAGWTSRVAGVDGEMCEACSAGKFKRTIGHDACEMCPNNTYVALSGSTSQSACEQCFNFSYSPEGSDSEEDCRCIGGYERRADP
jgi:hypothetical protein